MIIIQRFDTDDEHDEVRLIYESFGYGECVMSIRESDML
jgi:hypothetical protein